MLRVFLTPGTLRYPPLAFGLLLPMAPYPELEGFVDPFVIMGVLSLLRDCSVKPVDLIWLFVEVGLCLLSIPYELFLNFNKVTLGVCERPGLILKGGLGLPE